MNWILIALPTACHMGWWYPMGGLCWSVVVGIEIPQSIWVVMEAPFCKSNFPLGLLRRGDVIICGRSQSWKVSASIYVICQNARWGTSIFQWHQPRWLSLGWGSAPNLGLQCSPQTCAGFGQAHLLPCGNPSWKLKNAVENSTQTELPLFTFNSLPLTLPWFC